MNLISMRSSAVLRLALLVGLLLAPSAHCLAQTGSPPRTNPTGPASPGSGAGSTANSGVNSSNSIFDLHQAQTDAKNLVKSGDLAGAEQKLTASNATPPNTAGWHVETSHKLLQVAESFSREGDATHSATVVTQTLQHLASAVTLAQASHDSSGAASAQALTGFIHERYRGDIASAIASYQAALKSNPGSKAIQEHLDRLQQTDAILRARIQAKR